MKFKSIYEATLSRNALLEKADRVVLLTDTDLTPEERDLLKLYRQSLRDCLGSLTEETLSTFELPSLTVPRIAKYITPELFIEEPLKEKVVRLAQERLDAFARSRGYDNLLSACTYVASNNPQFATEAQRAVELRDATWGALWTLMQEVEAGVREVPSVDEVLSSLPVLTW